MALFSATSCFSCGNGMWPFSALPPEGREEGDEAEGLRPPRRVTFTERNCLAPKGKEVCFPSSAGSSFPCVLTFRRGKGTRRTRKVRQGCWIHLPASPLHPLLPPSAIQIHQLPAVPSQRISPPLALPSPSPVCRVIATRPSSLSLMTTSSWKPLLVGSPCNASHGSLCFPLPTLIPLDRNCL